MFIHDNITITLSPLPVDNYFCYIGYYTSGPLQIIHIYVRTLVMGWWEGSSCSLPTSQIMLGCKEDRAALYCCPSCWCPASDGSLKPGTQLKQTKASTELPLNPIKADFRRSRSLRVHLAGSTLRQQEQRGFDQKKKQKERLPCLLISPSPAPEQCRWALSIRLLFLFPISWVLLRRATRK